MIYIEKEAKCGEIGVTNRVFTSAARTALYHILVTKKQFSSKRLLVPSFIGLSKLEGSGVLDPIKKSGMIFDFYKVGRNLVPDLEYLEALLETGSYQLILLIHYFGASQVRLDQFIDLCHRYNVQVIEDCAHTITGGLSKRRLGTYGDYSIFSIHKATASKSGGFFVDNFGDVSSVEISVNSRINFDCLMHFANTDLNEISKIRIENYKKIDAVLSSFPRVNRFWNKLGNNVVPLNFPIILPNEVRTEIYDLLVSRGILPTALYHTLVPDIDPSLFSESVGLSKEILNLPVHQDIHGTNLKRYLDELGEIFGKV